MSAAPIYFQFNEKNAAFQALDTLEELGYRAEMVEHDHPEHRPTLQLFVDRNDLTSALEIAQAHGGVLLETDDSETEAEAFSNAYGLEGIAIPAHVVNEDLPEDYMHVESAPAYGMGEEPEGPSGEDYDHFPAGIRL